MSKNGPTNTNSGLPKPTNPIQTSFTTPTATPDTTPRVSSGTPNSANPTPVLRFSNSSGLTTADRNQKRVQRRGFTFLFPPSTLGSSTSPQPSDTATGSTTATAEQSAKKRAAEAKAKAALKSKSKIFPGKK